MYDWFDLDYKRDDGIIWSVVDREAAKCYKDWKSDLNNHFKSVGGAQKAATTRDNPPETLGNKEQWGRVATYSCLTLFR